MTQTSNRFFDEIGKLMTDAAGAAQGAQKEMESFMRAQGEKMLAGMDLVRRDEFEAVKAMAAKAREDSEALMAKVAALEAEIARMKGGACRWIKFPAGALSASVPVAIAADGKFCQYPAFPFGGPRVDHPMF